MTTTPVRSHTVTRNTAYVTLAFVMQKVLSFTYFVFYANQIGAGGTGKYIFAISFATIFGILVDLGFSPVLIREISRNQSRAQNILSNVLKIKLVSAIITSLGIVIIVSYLGYPLVTQQLIWMAVVAMVAESFSLTLYGVLRGFQNLKYEAIGSILYQILTMSVGLIGLLLTKNPLVLGVAVVFGSLTNFFFAYYYCTRKLKLHFAPQIEGPSARVLIKTALPFFLAGIFTKVYAYVDIVMLSFLKGDEYVGWYSIAYKLTYSLQFFPIAFSNAVYPVFSRQYISEPEKLPRTLERGLQYVILLGLPVSIGASILAEPLIATLWPTFVNAVPALRIGIFGLVFVFANFILSSFLNACNRQKVTTVNIGLTMMANIVLNTILIPPYAHTGAAIAAAVSALFFFCLNMFSVSQITSLRAGWLLGITAKTAVAAGSMGMLALVLPLPLFIVIAISAIVYVIAILVTRAVTLNDLKHIWRSLLQKKTTALTPE